MKEKLTDIKIILLEALKEEPKFYNELNTVLRDKMSDLKGGASSRGASSRAQDLLNQLEQDGFVSVIDKKFFGGRKYCLTEKGKQAIN